jgi:hypothetical protein
VFGGGGPLVALAGAALLVLLLGALVVGAIGGRGGQESDNGSGPPATTTTSIATATSISTTTASTPRRVTPVAPVVRDPIEIPDVYMEAIDRDAFAESPVVDELARRSVLRITASSFESNARGQVEQCTRNRCANPFPVLFDEMGSARIQYLVHDTIAAAGWAVATCHADEPPCVVRLRTETDTAFLTTVFGDVAPTSKRVTVLPSARDLVSEAAVTVTAQGFTPGARVHATMCAAPDTAGTERCGAPSPVAPFTIGADGTGRISLVIRGGHVGSEGAECGRDTPCGIVVQEEASAVPAPVVLVTFAAGPSARYESVRVLIGVALGSVLLAVALFLARRTDWRKPTEADTPELDRAVLSDL